ncbi:hypothetical protein H1S01_03275 [Heliobacterium chlorum]|uniref:Uncharacterized protein n=1 Tax=Heliobacterium chlorum TaxID=2698 RepID=A0ABR7T0M7_HELCL|nr:YjcQ family protein [Heliobacterium chlorum]MBC9783533.1 hypothetical protein [Heliobacterium chlorum]
MNLDMTKLDAKQKVLLAIYTEYQKDIPDMTNVTPESIGISRSAFNVAISKLSNEGLIDKVIAVSGDNEVEYLMHKAMMSREGISFVESKASIEPTDNGNQKIKKLMEECLKWGWEQAKDICAKALAEMAKGTMGPS